MIKSSSARTTVRAVIHHQNVSPCHRRGGFFMNIRFIHDHWQNSSPKRRDSAEDLELDFPRQTTILASGPSSIIQDEVIWGLKRKFRMSKASWNHLSEKEAQGLVILATPKFAQWLEDEAGFIPRVLEAISKIAKLSRPKFRAKHPCEIDVICACVDGLSPSVEFMPNQSVAQEGFSFLHGSVAHILPSLWAEETPIASSQKTPSSITFSGQTSWEHNVTMPLANTLFQTGKLSFLRASKWRRSVNLPFVKLKSIDKSHQTINVFDGMESDELLTYIPATPLTPARPIVNGMGNIVRRIDFGTDGSGPASRELETCVDQYRNNLSKISKSMGTSPFAVWALVVPETALQSSKPGSLHQLHLSNYDVRVGASKDTFYDYIGHWINQGATLCRVLSGGGGWGAKQGLLSLDPQRTYNEDEEPPLDFLNGSLEEQQISALGNLAQPGAHIQFFVGNLARSNTTPKKRLNYFDPKKRSVVIGTTPSTIDDIPTKAVDMSNEHVRIRNAHFGCVSQSGIYLSKKDPVSNPNSSESPPFGTKIDLPHSYVYAWMESAVMPQGEVEERLQPDVPVNREDEERV